MKEKKRLWKKNKRERMNEEMSKNEKREERKKKRERRRKRDEETGKETREERIKKNKKAAKKRKKEKIMKRLDEERWRWLKKSWEEKEEKRKERKKRESQRLKRHHQTAEEVASKIRSGRDSGLQWQNVENKGRGVFPTLFTTFLEGDFVCEYVGEHISPDEGLRRAKDLEEKGSSDCFIFDVEYKGERLCIDATNDDGRLGRLINHSRK